MTTHLFTLLFTFSRPHLFFPLNPYFKIKNFIFSLYMIISSLQVFDYDVSDFGVDRDS